MALRPRLDHLEPWRSLTIDFDFDLLRVVLAFILAVPLGWEGVQAAPKIDLRTVSIVAMASCGFVLIARAIPGIIPDAEAHIIQGLMAGIGFIGGGAILKDGGDARSLATAASIWTTGAIGAAVFGRKGNL